MVLHHWQKKQTAKPIAAPDATEDGAPAEEKTEEQPKEKDYQFARYNVLVDVPTYTKEIYDAQLKDDDWTKEETDYLMEVVKDFAQKWPVVVDRYDFHPTPVEGELEPAPKERSMEDLKARYYTVSARMLAQNTPISSMNTQQYSLYQTLLQFNAMQESSRKRLAEQHLYRTELEVQEETALLAELQRIMINQKQLEDERQDIRQRLDYPNASSTGMQYNTSQALGQLFQQLLQADRMKRDRKLKDIAASTPANAHGGRESIGGASSAAGPRRPGRESLASASGLERPDTEARSRQLAPREAARYFVTTHDKLSSGVSFASDKLAKPRTAKSTVQTERIASVLTHLRIPEVIPLPSQKVVEEFDKLMAKVNGLLEIRKVAEKEEQEMRVRMAEKGVKDSKAVKMEQNEGSDAAERGNSEAQSPSAARGQKRSASVLSMGSQQQGNKRTKQDS